MVRYFCADTTFVFKCRRFNNKWLKKVAENEGKILGELNIIFCSDYYLLEINKKFLSHNYFTDIITFDYCKGNVLSGDLFISVDSVRENATFYGVGSDEEFYRVMVHGLLHLIGYDDHTGDEMKVMREKENFYLGVRSKLT